MSIDTVTPAAQNAARVACISGGTSGIGRAIAENLLDDGFTVFAFGKNQRHADELSGDFTEHQNNRLFVRQLDVRDFDACVEIASSIEATADRLDLLVNAAGTVAAGGVEAHTHEQWERVISTNLTGAFNLTKSCLGLLKKTPKSSVINVSSVCSTRPCSSLSYSVSKAALDMLTKGTAKELGPAGIRVNAVSPGVVRTNLMLSAELVDDNGYDQWVRAEEPKHPIGRIGELGDVVSAVRFLASEHASWVTGAVLSVDGGRALS